MKNDEVDTENYSFISEPFLFLAEPSITVKTPAGTPIDQFGISGEKLYIDSLYTIEWIAEGNIKFTHLRLCDSTKKALLTITRDANTPGLHSDRSFNWKVPTKYGDTFYISFTGQTFDNDTLDIVYSLPFRINREASVISPTQGSTNVAFSPNIQLQMLPKATKFKVELKDSATNGEFYSKEFEAAINSIKIQQKIEEELQAGITYQLIAQAFFDTIASYKTQQYFTVKNDRPEAFEIFKPELADTTEGNELQVKWGHAAGADGYKIEITNKNNLLFSATRDKMDTSVVATLGNPGIPDTLFLTVTAMNDFGETISESYFFKKNRTGIEFIESKENPFKLTCFPNPIDQEATIEFNIENDQFVSLAIYSSAGQKVAELISGKIERGKHTIKWDSKKSVPTLNKGVYILRLSTNTKSATKTLVLE